MPSIKITTDIGAPIQRVFDLARSIDLHVDSTVDTYERAIAGVTSGLISLNQEVTWRAKHFGLWLELTSRITEFEPPIHFRDSMVKGIFRRFDHDHNFTVESGGARMQDTFDFDSPLWFLGRIANALFVTRHLRRLLETRNRAIKEAAETAKWRSYLKTD